MSMHDTHSLKAWKQDGAVSGKRWRRTDRNSAVNGKTPTTYFHKIRVAHRNHWCKPTTSRRILYLWSHPTCGLNTSRSRNGAEKTRWVLKAAHTLKWGDRSTWCSAYIKSQIHWRSASPPKISKKRTIILVDYCCFSITANEAAAGMMSSRCAGLWWRSLSFWLSFDTGMWTRGTARRTDALLPPTNATLPTLKTVTRSVKPLINMSRIGSWSSNAT